MMAPNRRYELSTEFRTPSFFIRPYSNFGERHTPPSATRRGPHLNGTPASTWSVLSKAPRPER